MQTAHERCRRPQVHSIGTGLLHVAAVVVVGLIDTRAAGTVRDGCDLLAFAFSVPSITEAEEYR